MEDILLRYPHLGEGILDKLDMKSVEICLKVSKSWQTLIDVEYFKSTYIRKITKYSNGSKVALEDILKNENYLEIRKMAKSAQEYCEDIVRSWGVSSMYSNIQGYMYNAKTGP